MFTHAKRSIWLDWKALQHLKIFIGFRHAHKYELETELNLNIFWLGNTLSCFILRYSQLS